MKRLLLLISTAFTLSSCGGGSSSDTGAMTNPTETATGTTTGTAENGGDTQSTGGTAGTTNPDGGTEETSGTTSGVTTTSESGDTGGSPSSNVTQLGTINMDVGDTIELEATFFSSSRQIPISLIEEGYSVSLDTCEVDTVPIGTIPGNTDIPVSVEGFMLNAISAGEVLTVSSPAGSYAELVRVQQFGITSYSLAEDLELAAPAPDSLSINIPGDEFTAFTNIALPVAKPLQVNSPGLLETITASTNFSWEGSADPDSFIEIFASAIAPDLMSITSVICEVADDGSFSFSSETQAELGSFTSTAFLERYTTKIITMGSSALVMSTLSERVN